MVNGPVADAGAGLAESHCASDSHKWQNLPLLFIQIIVNHHGTDITQTDGIYCDPNQSLCALVA